MKFYPSLVKKFPKNIKPLWSLGHFGAVNTTMNRINFPLHIKCIILLKMPQKNKFCLYMSHKGF